MESKTKSLSEAAYHKEHGAKVARFFVAIPLGNKISIILAHEYYTYKY